jgi:hypothetical protein
MSNASPKEIIVQLKRYVDEAKEGEAQGRELSARYASLIREAEIEIERLTALIN